MQRILFIIVFTWIIVSPSSAQNQKLVVWFADGGKAYYDLEKLPKTTFENNNIVITTDDILIHYPLEDVIRYTLETDITGINELHDNDIIIRQKDGNILLQNINGDISVKIFSLDGVLLETINQSTDKCVFISLNNYMSGTYLLQVKDKTYKILKK